MLIYLSVLQFFLDNFVVLMVDFILGFVWDFEKIEFDFVT